MTRPGPEAILRTKDVRVRIMPLDPEESVPWHVHGEVTDHMCCLSGRICVHAAEPDEEFRFASGQRCSIRPGRPHRMAALAGTATYLLVQGVGEYDFQPLSRS